MYSIQPLYSKVKTPTGWTTIGKIKINDFIIVNKVNLTIVINIYLQGVQDI